jgi:alpha-mannosidase
MLIFSVGSAMGFLEELVGRLRSRCVVDVMAGWRSVDGIPVSLNEKGQIAWAKGRESLELVQPFTLPESCTGMVARLGLTWWAETAEVFVAGVLVQSGDLFDHTCRVVLSRAIASHEIASHETVIEVRLKLVSPGHDIGALMRSSLIFEAADGAADAGFVADEVEIVWKFLTAFYPGEVCTLASNLSALDDLNDLAVIQLVLMEWSDRIKQYKIQCLGHAHLDLAWLWTVDETWKAAERTFVSALNLMEEFPDLIF